MPISTAHLSPGKQTRQRHGIPANEATDTREATAPHTHDNEYVSPDRDIRLHSYTGTIQPFGAGNLLSHMEEMLKEQRETGGMNKGAQGTGSNQVRTMKPHKLPLLFFCCFQML